jgi:cytochrome c biogenesis protein CcmG, thiol:disulfide interchange protein DsbE
MGGMSRRALALSLAAMALVAVVVIGLRQSGEATAPDPLAVSRPDPAEVRERLAGAPAPLAALHAQANELLPGEDAFRARLRELRGFPVVVNVWAAWCGPCREELPVFQEVAIDRGKEVAFLGVDLRDDPGAAKRLLGRIPQTYPSYEDPDGKIFDSYGVAGVPSTIFYDKTGKQVFVHQGPYLEREDLERDLERALR